MQYIFKSERRKRMFHHIWNVFFGSKESSKEDTLGEIIQNAMVSMEGEFNEQMLVKAVQEKIEDSHHEFGNEEISKEVREYIKMWVNRGILEPRNGMYYRR